MVPDMVRASETRNGGKKEPTKSRNVSKRGEARATGKVIDPAQNSPAELEVVDDSNAWETAMMQKFFSLTHTSL
jgi:hypothetical protein